MPSSLLGVFYLTVSRDLELHLAWSEHTERLKYWKWENLTDNRWMLKFNS